MYPYEILCMGKNCGIIECINNIITLDSLYKKITKHGFKSFHEFFNSYFRDINNAKLSFAYSLAAYSLVCFILRIKDRHNANIMIDDQGHLIHIDFGFMISNDPGNIEIDNTPFKLPSEWLTIIGLDGIYFNAFRDSMIRGFMAIQKNYPKILILVEAMYKLNEDLPCFAGQQKAIEGISNRLFPVILGRGHKRAMNPSEAAEFIDV